MFWANVWCADLCESRNFEEMWSINLQAKSEAEYSSSVGLESTHAHKLCYDACRMLQEVSPRTQPGPGVKKCQDPSLCQCGTTFKNPPRAPPASRVSNGSRRPNHCLWKWPSLIFFQRGSFLAIKSPPYAIQMKTSVGAPRRLEAVALISTQTSQAHTWRTCCVPRLMSHAGKCPRHKSSPAWSLSRWKWTGDDGGVFLQLAEDALKRLTNLLDPMADPDASSAEDDLEDCSDLGSLGKRLFVSKVAACDQCHLSSPWVSRGRSVIFRFTLFVHIEFGGVERKEKFDRNLLQPTRLVMYAFFNWTRHWDSGWYMCIASCDAIRWKQFIAGVLLIWRGSTVHSHVSNGSIINSCFSILAITQCVKGDVKGWLHGVHQPGFCSNVHSDAGISVIYLCSSATTTSLIENLTATHHHVYIGSPSCTFLRKPASGQCKLAKTLFFSTKSWWCLKEIPVSVWIPSEDNHPSPDCIWPCWDWRELLRSNCKKIEDLVSQWR